MAESRLDLNTVAREKSLTLLSPALAGATDLMLASKEAHWNVRGPNFIALHKLFDEFNAAMGDYVDELAERIIQLGGHAHGTLHAAAKSSTLPVYPEGLVQEKDHLKALAAQIAALGALARHGIASADGAGDAATADLFTELTRGLDKWLWFIEANI
jgi:starvation-inducible DNA-binding protein